MTLIDRYFAKRMFISLVQLMAAMILVYVAIDFLTARQANIAKYDIPVYMVIQFYCAQIPMVLFQYQTAALAVLVAVLMVLGKAAQDQEITAALAGGISLRRIVRAPVLVALVVAVTAFFVEDTLGVRASKWLARMDREYFSQFRKPDNPGISWTRLNGEWTCHILKFNREALTGQDVYIHSIGRDVVKEIRAKRIYWDETKNQWILEDGRWFTFNPNQEWEQKVDRITQIAAPFSESPEELFTLDKPVRQKSLLALRRDLLHAGGMGMPVNAQWVDYYSKIARPALCFVMVWLAIPFALRIRRGGMMMGFGVSIGIALSYLLIFYITMGLGHLDKLSPIVAAWSANAAFLVVGIILFRKTPT